MSNIITSSRTAAVILIQAVLLIGAPWAGFVAPGQAAHDDRAAVVNGMKISRAEFNAAVKQAEHQRVGAAGKVPAVLMRKMRKEVMKNLIGRRLAYQESLKLGIFIKSAMVDEEVARIRGRLPGDQQLEEVLDKAGISTAKLRLELKKDLAIRQLLDGQVIAKVKIDEREIRAFYDNNPNLFKTPALVKASHIFIAVAPEASKDVRKQAVTLIRAVQQKIAEGAEFAEMAIDYSQCPTSENGGDLGYFGKEKMIKGFAEAAFALNPGEISDIVRTRYGYHLIKVNDRQPKTKLSFEDVREKLARNLKFEKSTREINAYLKSLRNSAEVKIFIRL